MERAHRGLRARLQRPNRPLLSTDEADRPSDIGSWTRVFSPRIRASDLRFGAVAVAVEGAIVVTVVKIVVTSGRRPRQRRSHRFLTTPDPALTIGCVKGGAA